MLEGFPERRFQTARVTANNALATCLFELVVEGAPAFVPGQFVKLGLQVGGEPVSRAYSFSGGGGGEGRFLIESVIEGTLSPRLAELKPGDEVAVSNKAVGRFTLQHVPDAPVLWWFATGTGLGPFLAMLHDPALERFERVVLVHGCRLADCLCFVEQIKAVPRITYVPLVSREEAPGITRGRCTELMAAGVLEEQAGIPLTADHQVMLCGNPQMITDMRALLDQRGLRLHTPRAAGQIHMEKYW